MDTSGKKLMQWPIEEINNLRTKSVSLDDCYEFKTGSTFEISGITAAQVSFLIVFC